MESHPVERRKATYGDSKRSFESFEIGYGCDIQILFVDWTRVDRNIQENVIEDVFHMVSPEQDGVIETIAALCATVDDYVVIGPVTSIGLYQTAG